MSSYSLFNLVKDYYSNYKGVIDISETDSRP
jgi:hypothetical protein